MHENYYTITTLITRLDNTVWDPNSSFQCFTTDQPYECNTCSSTNDCKNDCCLVLTPDCWASHFLYLLTFNYNSYHVQATLNVIYFNSVRHRLRSAINAYVCKSIITTIW